MTYVYFFKVHIIHIERCVLHIEYMPNMYVCIYILYTIHTRLYFIRHIVVASHQQNTKFIGCDPPRMAHHENLGSLKRNQSQRCRKGRVNKSMLRALLQRLVKMLREATSFFIFLKDSKSLMLIICIVFFVVFFLVSQF